MCAKEILIIIIIVSSFPGATNDTLLSKFTHNHRGNPYYQVPQLKEGAFNVVHYAGKVKYFVKVSGGIQAYEMVQYNAML